MASRELAAAPDSTCDAGAPPRPRREVYRRGWAEASLRAKVSVLILLAASGGALIGMAEAQSGYAGWPVLAGLLLLYLALTRIAAEWIWRPIERLLVHLSRISRERRGAPIKSLPVHRGDEVGQLARIIHDLSAWAVRQHWDAAQLRRTFDDRLTKAMDLHSKRIAAIAMRDPLTGLGNRRFLEESLEPMFGACRAADEDLICLALDMDNFKHVNDTRGHARGDRLLREFANIIRGNIRRGDYAVRLGGDEFLVFLPGCTLERARDLSVRIITMFAQFVRHEYSGDPPVSVSIGIASLKRDEPTTGEDLVIKADQALYAAKRAGKNQWATLPT